MNIAHIEPFIDSTVGLFRDMFKIESEYLTPYLLNRDSPYEWDISGIIGISGDSRGVVVISFEAAFATEITAGLVGRKVGIDDPDVIDVIGELVNIVAGNAKKGLEEFRLSISLPSIVKGFNHRISWPSNAPIIGIPFKTASGKFHLSVGLENIITPF
jgi:chemotaxis protein CheX